MTTTTGSTGSVAKTAGQRAEDHLSRRSRQQGLLRWHIAPQSTGMPLAELGRLWRRLEYQAPLAADKVHVVAIDGLLADKFEAAELPSANTFPQREFCRRERPRSDRARSVRFWSVPRNALIPYPGGLTLIPTLSRKRGERVD